MVTYLRYKLLVYFSPFQVALEERFFRKEIEKKIQYGKNHHTSLSLGDSSLFKLEDKQS